jgi:sulfatase modifying factor 1
MHIGRASLALSVLFATACSASPAPDAPTKLWADPPRPDAKLAKPNAPTELGQATAAMAPETAQAKSATTPKAPPTCDAHPLCNGESCCTSVVVPAGSYRDERAGQVHVTAFALDKYELTVGRVAAWERAGSPTPAEGAVIGHDSAGRDVVWKAGFDVQKGKALEGWARYDTWRTKSAVLPKNFLDWYTAAAVCAMDGGRLPSDAEWRHAAVGGEEDRTYPWGSAPQTPERAIYNCTGNGDVSCSLADILPVGSRPAGAGRWGHLDLAGSMFEWTIDAAGAETSVNRGGGFCYIGGLDRRNEAVRTATNTRRDPPTTVSHMVGARCAYDVQSAAPQVASR